MMDDVYRNDPNHHFAPSPLNTWMLPNNSIAILAQKNYLH